MRYGAVYFTYFRLTALVVGAAVPPLNDVGARTACVAVVVSAMISTVRQKAH